MRRHILLLLAVTFLPCAASAQELSMPKPDDQVAFDLSAEDWAATKTARVTVNVESAVSAANAGQMRTDMKKAVDAVATGDWRLTNFNRSQDQTGMERWSTSYEARLPESSLGGLNDTAKKLSKAGMQLAIANIEFTPTLEEMEETRATLRTAIYKKAADQLTALNAALPGRSYRIAEINFGMMGGIAHPPLRAMPMAMMAGTSNASPGPENDDMQRSEKVHVTAHVVFAAVPADASKR